MESNVQLQGLAASMFLFAYHHPEETTPSRA